MEAFVGWEEGGDRSARLFSVHNTLDSYLLEHSQSQKKTCGVGGTICFYVHFKTFLHIYTSLFIPFVFVCPFVFFQYVHSVLDKLGNPAVLSKSITVQGRRRLSVMRREMMEGHAFMSGDQVVVVDVPKFPTVPADIPDMGKNI